MRGMSEIENGRALKSLSGSNFSISPVERRVGNGEKPGPHHTACEVELGLTGQCQVWFKSGRLTGATVRCGSQASRGLPAAVGTTLLERNKFALWTPSNILRCGDEHNGSPPYPSADSTTISI